ncbi:unnamed protein product [Rotaria sp. Silwood1]|nr:unnamed protein product [Rotaria sp. Silwood1]CAF1631053.1 unnamed protein product [Rotaria sp. Silwood1]
MPFDLTDISLQFHDVSFDEIEKFLARISSRLQRLYLTIHLNNTFLYADRWERLIRNHMPYLYIFDFKYLIYKYDRPNDYTISNQLFDRFKSSFWYERKWFFQYQHWSCKNDDFAGIFYSTNPYRRKCYELYRCETYETIVHSASHLKIGIDCLPNNVMIHFPNVTELTLIENDNESKERSMTNINCIIPLTQLTHLVIFDPHFSISQLIELLRFSSNMQSLTFIGVSFTSRCRLSVEQMDLVRSISKTSKVTELCIEDDCSLAYIQFFADLCPRLQRLEIVLLERQIKSIIQFLLSSNMSDLFWLCLRDISNETSRKVQKIIDHEKLIIDYNVKDHYTGLYFWW